jgi:Protein of unknown function (DUF1566)
MKWQAKVVPIFLCIVAMIAGAESSTEDRGLAQETRVRGYWTDPSTGLMWAGKDNNGKDVSWQKAVKYCRELRLAGYSEWRLATIDELEGIYNRHAEAPGLAGQHNDKATTWHVKGNLFLTGHHWSSTRRIDDRGRPSGYAWRFDFGDGRRFGGDQLGYSTFKRALCVRGSGKS